MGINLRTIILGVPPTLPALHHAIGLSYSAAGLLTSLPLLLMALGAIPGAFLISRVGPRRAVAAGLALVTLGAVMRAAVPSAAVLFLFTVVFAIGIAVSQPAMPSLAQSWFPSGIGRAIAVYSNGLLVGEVIAASLTLPLLLTPFGWQVALAAWAVPAGVVFALWLLLTPSPESMASVSRAWFPDWRSGRVLRVALLLGGASLVYFGMNAWVPDTLDARQAHSLIPLTLGTLNGMQLPVSLWLAIDGNRLLGRRWPYLLAALWSIGGITAYVLAPVSSAPIWAGVVGAGSSLAFVLTLGLPALLSPSEVARTSGLMFTIGYGAAFFGPALGGVVWDWSGQFRFALLPILVGSLAMLVFGATLPPIGASARARPAASATAS
ncbi:MAG TPA: MFS transporter [Candidatus Dormibacteraeota bacterium]|nr:MFS transporter [Candidatus Dormibacteraeota bacterium]